MKKRCLLCKSLEVGPFLEKFDYRLRECLNCGLVFLANPPTRAKLYRIYQKGYFNGDKRVKGYADYEGDRDSLIKNFSRRISIIKRYKKSGKLLDVGCATGLFIEEAQKEGFEVWGIDVSLYATSVAQKRFPKRAFLADLLSFSSNKKFDVITMWDVLEHFLEPKKNLLKANQLLKNNGLLILSTGNRRSLWARLAGKNWQGYNPPQHVFYFSPQTLKRILKETGFRALEMHPEGKWLSLSYILHICRSIYPSKITEGLYQVFGRHSVGKLSVYLNLYDSLLGVAIKKASASKKSKRKQAKKSQRNFGD